MIYVTGDTHGDLSVFNSPKLKKLTEKDYLIICGDFGFLWDNSEKEKKKLEKLKKKKYTICFLDGSHENFDILDSYTPYRWKGGNTHKIADNIYHLLRGEIFELEGKTFFVMGGGESSDREMRVEGESWWKHEMPTSEELINGGENLKAAGYSVNYILTHESPAIAKDFIKLHTNQSVSINILNNYLQELMKDVEYMHWYFGSIHADIQISRKMTAVFNNFIEIS